MAQFDETFDFVIVGSGGGAMCAALFMRTVGKSVVVLEKDEYVGGTTCKSGGVMWIPNNPLMRRDGIADSAEQAITYLDNLSGTSENAPGTTPERRRTYVAEAPRMLEFLMKQGLKADRADYWPDYHDELPGGHKKSRSVLPRYFNVNEIPAPWNKRLQPGFLEMPASLEEAMSMRTIKKDWRAKVTMVKIGIRMTLGKLTGKYWVSAGKALQGRMLKMVLKAGADIRIESPVSEIIIEDGKVTGVLTVKDGKPYRVGSRLGVLINAGGFARNQAMRDQYQPGTRAEWSLTARGDTGEMIREMMGKGAAIGQMEEMVGCQATIIPGQESDPQAIQAGIASPHAMLVDQSGVRYMNEGGSYMAFCQGMLKRNQTVPAIPSYMVFDKRFFEDYMFCMTMPGLKKPAHWFESGFVVQADSVAELAGKLGMDPATLTGTVDRFNGFVDKNKDEDFGRGDREYDKWLGDQFNKPSTTLGRIDQGPFFALKVVPGDVGTYGGVVTDEKARVLREDGSIIEGLYATGISTASVMGRFYPGAGSSVGPSFTWGWVAAKHAAGADNIA